MANMLTTYKRIKDRRRTTGEGTQTWEYYTQMDDLFGTSGIGTAPPGKVFSTPLGLENTPIHTTPTISQPPQANPAGEGVSSRPRGVEHPSTSTSRQRPGHSFVDTYEAHAERRTAVLESLVRPDLERWRRLKEKHRRTFERKLLASLGNIGEQLQEIGRQQGQIIELLKKRSQ
ncbi:uncharacterized protein LOC134039999 [Osmerus eperlanus]|uniref:uncharacterized protein LOC134039999 n=1 Tax=Osmerus eperlanus TaxID=29151 RepID=UPI002E1048A6